MPRLRGSETYVGSKVTPCEGVLAGAGAQCAVETANKRRLDRFRMDCMARTKKLV